MNYFPPLLRQFMSCLPLMYSFQHQEFFYRPWLGNLCFYVLLFSSPTTPPHPPPHSGYYSVICGVRWRELMRFRNLLSSVGTFIMWCWACTLVSLKFYRLVYKINTLKRIPWKAPVGGPKFHYAKHMPSLLLQSRTIMFCFLFLLLSFPLCLVHVINLVLMKWILVQ